MKVEISEKAIQKEAREHAELVRKYGIGIAVQMARDHAMRKTTTKKGKTLYMREYMRNKRQQQSLPSLSEVIGLRMPKGRKRL